MTERQKLYEKLRDLHLQDEIKKVFGKNFTQVSSDNLIEFINKQEAKKVVTFKEPIPIYKIDKLIKVLSDKRILLKSEVDFINQ